MNLSADIDLVSEDTDASASPTASIVVVFALPAVLTCLGGALFVRCLVPELDGRSIDVRLSIPSLTMKKSYN